MQSVATNRLIIFALVAIVLGVLFFFEPALNIGMPVKISMYEQLRNGHPFGEIIIKLLILTSGIFFGLIFLVGLKPKPKSAEDTKLQTSEEFEEKKD